MASLHDFKISPSVQPKVKDYGYDLDAALESVVGLRAIIPEVTDAESLTGSQQKQIDLSQSMEALFRDYFRHEKGQEPNVDLMNLFTEILAEGN